MNIVQVTRTFAVAMVLVVTATGLWAAGVEEESAAAVEREMVTDPATGMTWTAPEYGGTLTWGVTAYPENTDIWWVSGWAPHLISGVNERLAFANWAISREIWDGTFYVTVPVEANTGALAESWSQPDPTTFVYNIRQGVHWHDKAPMNGRQLTAKDVEWNWHRYWGLGDFAEDGPSAHKFATTLGAEVVSATATDEWTVVVELAEPNVALQDQMLNNYFFVYPPEVIEEHGDYKDWRNVVGTGPFELTEYVDGSSATWEKNPDYWGYDEKFPDNRLPYVDQARSLMMKEMSTRLAALRTGKIDMLSNTGDARIFSLDDVESLQKSNPEIDMWPGYGWVESIFLFNWALAPVSDARVRQALQLAVDRETIADSFYKGYGDPAPHGLVMQAATGWAWPYDEWPEEVKNGYRYDPEAAEALLDEAGYPRGADGTRFTVKFAQFDRWDPTYAEVILGYFDAIGVKGQIVIQTIAEVIAANKADTHEWELVSALYGFHGGAGYVYNVSQTIDENSWNKAKDPRMDEILTAAKAATDVEEFKSLFRQADEITIREHWALLKPNTPKFSVSQPWVQGYFGESGMGWGERNTFMARLWIDSQLKAEMGN